MELSQGDAAKATLEQRVVDRMQNDNPAHTQRATSEQDADVVEIPRPATVKAAHKQTVIDLTGDDDPEVIDLTLDEETDDEHKEVAHGSATLATQKRKRDDHTSEEEMERRKRRQGTLLITPK